ncbi:hypothetical protein HanRHA438_Chr09g0402191 [Helianthus annuus]|nr:hypothetical protein HanRHA438_Chr09g0402191 [Helianthus annuus]
MRWHSWLPETRVVVSGHHIKFMLEFIFVLSSAALFSPVTPPATFFSPLISPDNHH